MTFSGPITLCIPSLTPLLISPCTGFGPGDIGYLVRSDEVKAVLSVVRSATNETLDLKMKKVRVEGFHNSQEPVVDII